MQRMQLRMLAAIALGLGLIGAAIAQDNPATSPRLPTDAPVRLATDAPVRAGMLAIRDLVRLNHSLVTHRRMPPDHAARFARQVKAEADKIAATSRISGDARDKLQALIKEIVGGIDAVAGRDASASPMDGLVRADEALARYAQDFDHPGWVGAQSPVRSGQ
jgi:hypothetical protein